MGSPTFAVAQYANAAVVVHSELNSLLNAIVATEKLPASEALSSAFQMQIQDFESVWGPNTDSQYLSASVAEHQDSITLYQTEVANGQDPLLVSYAQSSLPVLHGYLNQAANLQSLASPDAW